MSTPGLGHTTQMMHTEAAANSIVLSLWNLLPAQSFPPATCTSVLPGHMPFRRSPSLHTRPQECVDGTIILKAGSDAVNAFIVDIDFGESYGDVMVQTSVHNVADYEPDPEVPHALATLALCAVVRGVCPTLWVPGAI